MAETMRIDAGVPIVNLNGMVRIGDFLYLITNRRAETGRLERMSAGGGPLEVLDTPGGNDPGSALVHDPAHRMLYWTNWRNVRRYSLDTGEASDVVACRGAVVRLDSTNAYLTEGPSFSNAFSLWSLPLSELATWEDRFERDLRVPPEILCRDPPELPGAPVPPRSCTPHLPCAP